MLSPWQFVPSCSPFLPTFAKMHSAPLITGFWMLLGNVPMDSPQFLDYIFSTTSLTDGDTSRQRGLSARYLPGEIPPLCSSVASLLLSLRKALSSPPEDWFDFVQFKGIRSILMKTFKKEYYPVIFGLVPILDSQLLAGRALSLDRETLVRLRSIPTYIYLNLSPYILSLVMYKLMTMHVSLNFLIRY